MMTAFVFRAGGKLAVSKDFNPGKLPAPKTGKWKLERTADETQLGSIGFDPEIFEKQGFQIRSAAP